eukprot:COSAG02_NODE_3157_length_7260_cov_20.933808_11_plen_102_part_00
MEGLCLSRRAVLLASQTGIQQSFIVCVLVRPWPCRCCAAAAAASCREEATRTPRHTSLRQTIHQLKVNIAALTAKEFTLKRRRNPIWQSMAEGDSTRDATS